MMSVTSVFSMSKNYRGEKKRGLKQSKSSSALHGGYETIGAAQEKTQNPHRTHIISEVRKLQTMQ